MPDMLDVVVLIVVLGCAAFSGYRCGSTPAVDAATIAADAARGSEHDGGQRDADENPVYEWDDRDWGEVFETEPARPITPSEALQTAQPMYW